MATLVTYFSAEGPTAKVAKEFAAKIGADIFEIVPETPYTKSDINWVNPVARCNREQMGHKDVPAAGRVADFEKYDTVYIGFPIWYGQAPRVVYTFVEGYDWSGKTVIPFTTHEGSGWGNGLRDLKAALPKATIGKGLAIQGSKVSSSMSQIEKFVTGGK